MNTQELIEKSKTENLSEAEMTQLLTGMNDELLELKAKDSKKYLELLTELNSIVSDLNTDLKKVTA